MKRRLIQIDSLDGVETFFYFKTKNKKQKQSASGDPVERGLGD